MIPVSQPMIALMCHTVRDFTFRIHLVVNRQSINIITCVNTTCLFVIRCVPTTFVMHIFISDAKDDSGTLNFSFQTPKMIVGSPL